MATPTALARLRDAVATLNVEMHLMIQLNEVKEGRP